MQFHSTPIRDIAPLFPLSVLTDPEFQNSDHLVPFLDLRGPFLLYRNAGVVIRGKGDSRGALLLADRFGDGIMAISFWAGRRFFVADPSRSQILGQNFVKSYYDVFFTPGNSRQVYNAIVERIQQEDWDDTFLDETRPRLSVYGWRGFGV